MTNTADQTPTNSSDPGDDSIDVTSYDPRPDYIVISNLVADLIDAAQEAAADSPEMLGRPTPCTEFDVATLLDHLAMVVKRIVAVGADRHFSTVTQVELGGGWAEAFRADRDESERIWSTDARMVAEAEVPWGRFPGGAVLAAYCTELAMHGWDLSTATGIPLDVPEVNLQGPLAAARFGIPAEPRGGEIPFGPVVEVEAGAPPLDQLAGWLGRSRN